MAKFFSPSLITGNVVKFVNLLLIEVTILTSTAISVDRLLALLLGLRYRLVVTLRRVRVVILCIWLVAAFSGSLTFFIRFEDSFKLILTLTVLSLVISIGSNTKIFFILRHQEAQLQDSVQQGQPNVEGIPLNIARYKKIVLAIIWVQLASVACYLPFIITFILAGFYQFIFQEGIIYDLSLGGNSPLSQLIFKPDSLLLENQRGQATSEEHNPPILLLIMLIWEN